ncbi:prolipoprotein diacylglyceryl transferase [Terriglobus sp. RCC_193]|uniref:prolipoprotein diacylglyceryl transferase n=1 Tax=Terriglobus sp. RCC_193 TaxID=3239218 RepID=UPI00352549B3
MHPHLFRIGPVTVPTFGAIAALGLVLAISLAARGARVMRLNEDAVWNLCLWMAAGTLVLSRLIIVAQVWKSFAKYPLYILTLPTVTKWGLLLALGSGAVYVLVKRLPWLRTLDALAPAALLLQAFLHLGTHFSGDDLGLATSSRLGVVFGDQGYHPVALYSAVLTLVACAVAFVWLHRESQPGETFGLSLTLAALIRFFVDTLRPGWVLPATMIGNLLRVDQLVLVLLAVAGLSFFFQRKGVRYAQ